MKDTPIIAIVGGGASGLAAAIEALRHCRRANVIVLEKLERVGKKLLATGNGRCNITNINASYKDYGTNQNFVKYAMEKYSPEVNMEFFRSMGLICRIEDEGRVYPYSGSANSVLDTLRHECERLGAELICGSAVQSIRRKGKAFEIAAQDKTMTCDKVIVATGGKASPKLGSNGEGYKLLSVFGHHAAEPLPALVQLKCDSPYPRQLKGIRFTGTAKLKINGNDVADESGEILFTDYGLSGVAVMQLSRHYAYAVKQLGLKKVKAEIALDFMPEYSFGEVLNILEHRIKNLEFDKFENFMTGILQKRIYETVLKASGVAPSECGGKLKDVKTVKSIVKNIKGFTLRVSGTKGFENAQLTCGGIPVDEVDSYTMESKLCKGVYIVGELVDVDGPCGGYNLQWAWSSGRMAGECAGKSLNEM